VFVKDLCSVILVIVEPGSIRGGVWKKKYVSLVVLGLQNVTLTTSFFLKKKESSVKIKLLSYGSRCIDVLKRMMPMASNGRTPFFLVSQELKIGILWENSAEVLPLSLG
jgi:hypothetical protein